MSLFGRKKEMSVFQDLESVQVDFRLPAELHTQVDMIGLTENDVKRLYCLKPIIESNVESLVSDFYDTITKEESLTEIINKHSNVEKLGKTLYNHIVKIFSGEVNSEYVAQRKQIAHVHVRIGLGTKWYVNAFQQLMNSIIKLFYKEIQNREELYAAIDSLQKIFSLEQQLVLDSYERREEENREEKEKEKEKIRQQMKETAHELSAIAEETSESLVGLVSQFANIQTLTDDGHQAIMRVESLSEDGKVRMGQEKESVEKTKKQIASLQIEINEMYTLSQKISKVVEAVSSVASEINLLALNASIESAHAGEHGKGFAVVAHKIRNLSDLTKESAEDIAELVKGISSQVQDVRQSVIAFNQDIVKNQEVTEETIEFLNQIIDAVKQSKEKTEVVFEEIKKSDVVLNQINEATSEITNTAEMLR
ncbi:MULTISPECIES: globin-coupled sensor protein [Bacillus cereus group]|uniref:globin-coupled sensor protein n=1 Tax=Bacillus cereus group TaxID=86661 RepID=UPI0022E3DFF0|nr:globin-coupled sensor protein [Bacillus cereus group sp. TH152-1LC]MDA1675255.1 globin-coupled sensor protein [Bacillus cereus group sp. TH152-1LC]